jgi:2-methylisocitrate lyase-like PEP mutase family enzyme
MTQAGRFRALLRRDGMFVAPSAYDGITAKLIEQAGSFQAGMDLKAV